MKQRSILAISRDYDILNAIKTELDEKCRVETFDLLLDGIDALRKREFDLLIIDANMNNNGFNSSLRKMGLSEREILPIALIDEETEEIINDIKDSEIFGYMVKPFSLKKLNKIMLPALNSLNLLKDKKFLESKMAKLITNKKIVGQHQKIKELKLLIDKVADTDMTVLVSGEKGVGKSLVVDEIHNNSFRKKERLVYVNCANILPADQEVELFGSDTSSKLESFGLKKGSLEMADGGTLVINQVDQLDIKCQAKLLRALEYGEYKRQGGTNVLKTDVRYIFTSNTDLNELCKKGSFRKDLYNRINACQINVPALRERKEDIPLLANFFLNEAILEYNKEMIVISEEVMRYLMEYYFPGNIRELKNIIERMVILSKDKVIGVNLLPMEIKMKSNTLDNKTITGIGPIKEILEKEIYDLDSVEKVVIASALQKTRWNKQETAKLLGIGRTTLYEKIRKYELDRRAIVRKKNEE